MSGTTGSTINNSTGSAGSAGSMQSASGEVDKIDNDKKTLTLKDGHSYKLDDSASLQNIKKGDRVSVTYRQDGGDRRAVSVTEGSQSGSSATGTTGTGSSTGDSTMGGASGTKTK
ncbi:DUF1344 domain-containing protein [Azospirillum sp. INR13]|uniref:DUF1344 domain-containing protein n=1 Tax=Azospirillum sp. INR13 TaxID=2596919 RepID=UPI0018920692|nr:DUF1344 domain-containing protein [Azospirillum sp. INR13]